MFYVLATAAMYLLCFGPRPRFLGEPFMYRAPYSWLMALPGYDAVRVPARFAMLAALCLSVVAALSFVRLTRRARWSIRAPLAAMVVAGVLVDSWIGEMPLPKVPFRLQALESLPERTVVMELPLGGTSEDVAAMTARCITAGSWSTATAGFFREATTCCVAGWSSAIRRCSTPSPRQGEWWSPSMRFKTVIRDGRSNWRRGPGP